MLIETSNAVDAESPRIRARIEHLRRAIQDRQPILDAAAKVPEQRALCERIAAGTALPPGKDAPSLEGVKQYLTAMKGKLKQLIGMAMGADKARAANAVDEAAIAKLQAELQDAGERYRQACFEPEAMSFT